MTTSIFTTVINSYLPEPHASLLNGIIFGSPIKVLPQFYSQVKTVGLLHMVVLSGTNITILSAITASFTLFLGKRISCLITILTIILFILFVGPQAPSIRSGFMSMLTLVAILTGRKAIALYLLFLSAILTGIVGVIHPGWVKSLSFQLSFGATLGIILLGEKLVKNNSVRSVVMKELRPTLSAQIFTVPIIFLYFKEISLIAPLSNILTAPIIPPLMIFGFLTAILGKVHFILGLIPSYICFGLLHYMITVIELLSKVPFAYVKF